MSVHLPADHDRDAWQLAVWNADDAVLTRPQKLELTQMVEVRYNLYDPFRVVGDLLRHRDLWRSVLMSRGFPTQDARRPDWHYLHSDLIPLRDLPQGHWNVDTVYLLHEAAHTAALTRLAGGWRADEVDAITGDAVGQLLGAGGRPGRPSSGCGGTDMPYRDPKCVYVADDFGTAGLVVSWLGSHGIEAVIMDEATQGGLEGLTWMAPGRVSTRGLEVWATTPEDAARGRELLDTKTAEIRAAKAARAGRVGTVSATCEACGTTSEFPMARAGRTENCPHCRAYLDVPDPDAAAADDDWDVAGDEPEPPGGPES